MDYKHISFDENDRNKFTNDRQKETDIKGKWMIIKTDIWAW